MTDNRDSLISMIQDLYLHENPEKAKRLKPEVYDKIINSYQANYEDIVRGIYEKENPEKAKRLNESVFKNIAQKYNFDFAGGTQELPRDVTPLQTETKIPETQQDKSVTPGITPLLPSDTIKPQIKPEEAKWKDEQLTEQETSQSIEPEKESWYWKTAGPKGTIEQVKGLGHGFLAAGKSALGSMALAVEDQSLKLNNLLKEVSENDKWQNYLLSQDERIKGNVEDIKNWTKNVPELSGGPGEFVGGLLPFAGMAIATALTKSPAMATAMTGMFAEMGYGEGVEAVDNHAKETGKPVDEATRTGAGVLYAAAYAVPFGGYLGKMIPKGVVNKAVAKGLTTSPELTGKFGKAVFEEFMKKQPQLAIQLAKSAGQGALTMNSIQLSKLAVDDFLIGRDVKPQEWWNTVVHSTGSGILFGLMTGPFAIHSQNETNTQRRNAQGDVVLTMDAKGNPVEIIPTTKGGKQRGLTPDGKIIDVTSEMVEKSFTIPTKVFNQATQIYKETGKAPQTLERDAYSQRVVNYGSRIADKTGIIRTIESDEGQIGYIAGKGDRPGTVNIINKAGEIIPNIQESTLKNPHQVTTDEFYRAMMAGYDNLFTKKVTPGPKAIEGTPEGTPPPPAPKTPAEQIEFYRGIIQNRAENTVKNKLHTSGKFITVQNEEGKLFNVKDGDLNNPSGVIIVYDETGEPKPVSTKTVRNWETKEPDAVIQELIQGFDTGIEQNVLQPQVGERITYQDKEYQITDDLGEYYILWDGQSTPIEVPKQELIQKEQESIQLLEQQKIQAEAQPPVTGQPEGEPQKIQPKEQVINTARIGKTDYQYTADEKGVFEFQIPDGMDPRRVEKEIKSTLPGEENRIQLITEQIEKTPEFPWQKPVTEKIIKAIRILPEAPKPAKIFQKQDKKLPEIKLEIPKIEPVGKMPEAESSQEMSLVNQVFINIKKAKTEEELEQARKGFGKLPFEQQRDNLITYNSVFKKQREKLTELRRKAELEEFKKQPPIPVEEWTGTDNEYISLYSEDKDEIFNAYKDEEASAPINKMDEWQKVAINEIFSTDSFNRLADRNLVDSRTFARAWLQKDGKPIDTFVSEWNDQIEQSGGGMEPFTVKDIIDFMLANPDKNIRKTTGTQWELRRRYREVFGETIDKYEKPVEQEEGKTLFNQFINENNLINEYFTLEQALEVVDKYIDRLSENDYIVITNYLNDEIARARGAEQEWFTDESEQEVGGEDETDESGIDEQTPPGEVEQTEVKPEQETPQEVLWAAEIINAIGPSSFDAVEADRQEYLKAQGIINNSDYRMQAGELIKLTPEQIAKRRADEKKETSDQEPEEQPKQEFKLITPVEPIKPVPLEITPVSPVPPTVPTELVKPTQQPLFGEIETADQTRQKKLQEKLAGLTPAQQDLAKKAIDEYEKKINQAKYRTDESVRDLEKAKHHIIREFNKSPDDRESVKHGGIIFDIPADLSKENMDRVLQPLKDKITASQKEYFDLIKQQEKAVDDSKNAAQAQGDMFAQPKDEGKPELELQQAESEVELFPSDAQKEAGNYKKGHVNFAGFDITIENPRGSERSGTDKTGKEWTRKLNNTYGYFKRTKGKDGDQIDVFLGDNPDSDNVFIIDQVNPENSAEFDEHKVMLGFDTEDDARQAYFSNYEPGWKGLRDITEVSKEKFKEWLDSGTRKLKPFTQYKEFTPAEKPTLPQKGEKYRVTHFYANIPVGTEGEVVKSWIDPNENNWVTLYFGKNLSGQKLQKSFPLNVVEKIEETPTKLPIEKKLEEHGLSEFYKRTRLTEKEAIALNEINKVTAPSRLTRSNLSQKYGSDVIEKLSDKNYILFGADFNKFSAVSKRGRDYASEFDKLQLEKKPIEPETPVLPLEMKLDEISKQPKKIEDFGEKIEGAKKMIYKRLNDVTETDIINQPLSKTFPRPDFVQLVKDGTLSEDGALVLKFLYDNIPPKPRKQYRLQGWAKTVQQDIDIFTDLLDNKENGKKIADKLREPLMTNLNNKFNLFEEVQKALGFPNEDINMGVYEIKKFHRGEKAENVLGTTYSIVKSPYIISDHKTAQEAADALKKMFAANKEKSKDVKLSIYQDRKTGKYFIGKKTATGVFRLIDGIETVQEARNKVKNEMAQLQELWNSVNIKPEERRETNRKRIGTDYRNGKNITPEEFGNTFGFRGVQFGNWVENDKRQNDLNQACDALMDLSTALNVSSRALSLGGELGIAFGARGSGKYSAHYESGQVVINLTKTRGAGSLAHEWWHALDSYFSRKRGDKSGFLTQSPRQKMNVVGREVAPDESLRTELIDAFKNVVETIRKSELPNRSKKLDSTRSDLYWSTIEEMSARSFENFIIEKLGATNEQNDYLANFKETEEWIKSGLDTNNYPYPTKEETPAINEAFQQFFDTIQEKQEDGQTILYEPFTSYSDAEQTYTKIKQKHPDSIVLVRSGDFYETFGDDAIKVSKNLGTVLTKSPNGNPRAGFPVFNLDNYLPKLTRAGYKVALADVLETPEKSSKLQKKTKNEEILYKEEAIQTQLDWEDKTVSAKRDPAFGSDPATRDIQRKRNYIPDIDNRLTAMERQLSDKGYLTFMGEQLTGSAKIESPNDIAFLFKNLESATNEHAFAVLIDKKWNYRVQYLSTGGTAGTVIDHKLIMAAAAEFNAVKVSFVHNHPSGTLMASAADINISKKLKEACTLMSIEYLPSVIIDIDKGKYAIIDILSAYGDIYEKREVRGKIQPIRVYQFEKQKFYVNSEDRTQIRSSHDVALFLSKQKRGTTNKTHVLILDRGNNINRYYLIDETTPVSQFIKQLYVDVGRHGNNIILASNGMITIETVRKIKNALQPIDSQLLDVLTIKQDENIITNYESMADEGMLYEPEGEYEVHEGESKLTPSQKQINFQSFDVGEESAELAFDKKRMLQLLGSKMYEAPIAQVAVKELLQNSFDAVKAMTTKTGEEGKIDFKVDYDERTIEIRDNGVGMTPDIVKNAFLTVGGTSKEGLGVGESSGGFGLAKVQFLLGSERIELETTRDGLTTTINTTNFELYNGSFKLKKEHTNKPNGTMVRITIPGSYTDFYGADKEINFPGKWNDIAQKWEAFSILKRPLLGNVNVNFKAISYGREHEQMLPSGNNAKEKVPSLFTTAEFNWGEADLYMSEEKKEYPTHEVLSAGIYQFEHTFIFREFDKIPYDIIVNIKSYVAPTDEYYPFNNQREAFSPAVQNDIKQLGNYIRKFASGEAEKEAAATFSDLRPLPKVDINKSLVEGAKVSPLEYASKIRELNKEFNIEKEIPKYARIIIRYEDIYIPSGTGYKKIETEKEYETSFQAKREIEGAEVDVEFLNPDDPQMHNNTNVDFMGMEGGIEFFADLGAVLKDFVKRAGDVMGYGYEKIRGGNVKYFTGISIDKEYAGVHVQKILNAIFFNPLGKDYNTINEAIQNTLHVFLHELAHEGSPGGHDERFAIEISDLYAKMADEIFYFQPLLRILYQKHFETYRRLKHEYNKSSTKNLSRTLKERDDGQRYSALRVGIHEGIIRERPYSGERRERRGEIDKTGEEIRGEGPGEIDKTGEIIISKLNEGIVQEPQATYGGRPVTKQVFYSPTEKALQSIKQEKGTPDQMKAMLLKNGAKEAELDWMGWDEAFTENIGVLDEYEAKLDAVYDKLQEHEIDDMQWGDDTEHAGEYTLSKVVNGEWKEVKEDSPFLTNNQKELVREWNKIDKDYQKAQIQKKKSITKADIQDWINQNKVEIEEVTKGIKSKETRIYWNDANQGTGVISYTSNTGLTIHDYENGEVLLLKDNEEIAWFTTVFEAKEAAKNEYKQYADDTKFSQWQLPGGENYKEVLLTMPTWEKRKVRIEQLKKEIRQQAENTKEWRDYTDKINTLLKKIHSGEGRTDDILPKVEKLEQERELIAEQEWGDKWAEIQKLGEDNYFKSSHFDEPNILAHVRFNERNLESGEKVLFLEEIQSDWAEKGRKEGFKDKKLPELTLPEGWTVKQDDKTTLLYSMRDVKLWKVYNEHGNQIGLGKENKDDAIREAKKTGYFKEHDDVPDMPFKQTSQWVNLVLRRMIRYAAENGFDKVAWTNGEMQAERYDLSKQVDYVRNTPLMNSRRVFIKMKENNQEIQLQVDADGKIFEVDGSTGIELVGKNLDEVVGKDLAEKIMQDEEGMKFSGLDLKVGGEGMKAFYDQIVRNAANSLGKKFGARVEETDIGVPKFKIRLKNNGFYEISDIDGNMVMNNVDPSKIDQWKQSGIKVQSLPITPQMKESALREGMPLFEPESKYGLPEKPKKENYPSLPDYLKALEKFYKDNPNEKPPIKQKITKAQNAVLNNNDFLDENIEAHRTAMEVYAEKEKGKPPTKETIDKMREFWIDDNFPIRRWQEAVIEHGGKLPDTEHKGEKTKADSYRDIRNMFGRMEILYEEFQQENIEPITKSFTKIIKSGMKSKGILPYMICKHGLERNRVMREEKLEEFQKRNPDATMDELFDYEDKLESMDFAGLLSFDLEKKFENVDDLAEAIIKGFESQVDPVLVEELWENTRKATDYTLNTWLKGGQISQKTYDYLKERYDNFIPLRGWREGAAKFLRYKNEGYGIGASFKRAFGRTSLADNPIAYIQAVGFKAINEQVANEVKQEALKIIFENYGKEFKDLHQIKKAYLVEKEIWNEQEQMYENVWSLYRDENGNLTRPPVEMFKEGKVKTEVNSEHEKLRTVWNALQHEVIVMNNGEPTIIVFPEKQLSVAQAFNNQNTMVEFLGHVFDARKLGETWIFRGLGAWTNFMKAMMTGYNPVFPFSNFSRDQLEASLTQNIRLNTRITKIPKNIPVAARTIIRNIGANFDPGNKYDVEYRNCGEAGGFTGFTHEKTIKQLEKELKKELKRVLRSDTAVGKTWDKLTGIFRIIEYWNRIFEDTTRFGVYMDARDKGLSIKDSAFESRNASVDFNMKGKGTRAIESIYAFFKVSMSALQKNFQLTKINPRKFIKNATAILAWGFLEAMLNDWDDDKNEDEKYYRINNYVRENYLVIRKFWGNKEEYLRVPISQFWRGFHAMGVSTYDYVNGKIPPGTAIARSISNLIAGMAPIDVTSFIQEGKLSWAPLIPTTIKPIQEIDINKDFMGNKISYEAFTKELEENLADSGLHKKYVNPAAKFITDVLFELGGGKTEYKFRYGKDGKLKYVPGIFDWNPSKIEHLISGYLGGVGRFTNDFMSTMGEFITGDEEYKFYDWPFINFFIRKIPDEKWTVLEKYYDYKKHISNAKIIADKAIREGDLEEIQKYISGDYPKAIEILSGYESNFKVLKDKYGEDIEGLQGIEGLSNLMIELRQDAINELDKLNINKP